MKGLHVAPGASYRSNRQRQPFGRRHAHQRLFEQNWRRKSEQRDKSKLRASSRAEEGPGEKAFLMVKKSARRTWHARSSAVKARVALSALREHKTMAELCQAFARPASQVTDRNRQRLEGETDVFGGTAQGVAAVDLAPLHAKGGQLSLEDDFWIVRSRARRRPLRGRDVGSLSVKP